MKKTCSTLILFFCSLYFLLAQNEWRQFQNPETTNDLLETENHLWFATNSGIIQLNKSTFEKTYFNPTNSSLTDTRITALAQDADDKIWMAQSNLEFGVLNGEDWILYEIPDDLVVSFNPVTLNDLIFDDNNVQWFATSVGALSFQNNQWEHFDYSNTNSNFLGNAFALEIDNQGKLIVSGITNILFDGTEWVDLFHDSTSLFSYDDAALYRQDDGIVWYHNHESAIGKWDGTSWEEYTLDSAFWYPAPPNKGFKNIVEGQNGYIYLSTNEEGLYRLEFGIWQKQIITFPIQLIEYGHAFFHLDHQNDFWFFNQNEILNIKNSSNFLFDQFYPHTIKRNTVHLVKKDNFDKLYFANGNIGDMAILEGDEWSSLETPFDTFPYFVRPKDMEFDADNNMWLGTNRGLFFYDNNDWTYFEPWTVFPSNSINSLELDENENVWMGTSDGLVKYDGQTFEVFDTSNSPLISDFVQYLSMDLEGNLWMKSSTTFIRKWYKFDGTDWEIFDANSPAILSGSAYEPFVDVDNNIWFARQSDGMVKYDGTNWTEVTSNNSGLIEDHVYSMEQDENGTLYFGTKNGIYTLKNSEWESLLTTETPLPETNILSLEKKDNVLWIGTNWFGAFAYNEEGFPTGIQKVKTKLSWSTSPNPTSDILNVEMNFSKKINDVSLSIFNTKGQLLKTFSFGEKQIGNHLESISVKDFAKGIYVIQLNLDGIVHSKKIIKM